MRAFAFSNGCNYLNKYRVQTITKEPLQVRAQRTLALANTASTLMSITDAGACNRTGQCAQRVIRIAPCARVRARTLLWFPAAPPAQRTQIELRKNHVNPAPAPTAPCWFEAASPWGRGVKIAKEEDQDWWRGLVGSRLVSTSACAGREDGT